MINNKNLYWRGIMSVDGKKTYLVKKYIYSKRIANDALNRTYKKGAYLIVKWEYQRDGVYVRVYGLAPITADSEAIKKELLERSDEFQEDVVIQWVRPTPRTITLDIPELIKRTVLGNYAIGNIDNIAERLMSTYNIEMEEVRFLIIKDDRDSFLLLGATIENLTTDSLKKKYGFSIEMVTYDWIIQKKDNKIDNKKEIIKGTQDFLNQTNFNSFYCEIAYSVLGQASLETVLVGIYAYLNGIASENKNRANILIVGSSGTGKTQTYRELKRFFLKKIPNLPICHIDMTMVTSEGFKGNNTNYIVAPILDAQSGGYGIVFIDEFDKRICPSFDGHGRNINADIQAQILTLIEGRIVTDNNRTIDTNNTLFIFCGSFDSIRNEREITKTHMGFGLEFESGIDYWDPITRQDIIKLGASYEILGRIPIIANYGPLNEEALAIVAERTADKVAAMLQIEVSLTERMMKYLFLIGRSKFGCRDFETNIFTPAFKAYGEAMKERMIDFVVIIHYDDASEEPIYQLRKLRGIENGCK